MASIAFADASTCNLTPCARCRADEPVSKSRRRCYSLACAVQVVRAHPGTPPHVEMQCFRKAANSGSSHATSAACGRVSAQNCRQRLRCGSASLRRCGHTSALYVHRHQRCGQGNSALPSKNAKTHALQAGCWKRPGWTCATAPASRCCLPSGRHSTPTATPTKAATTTLLHQILCGHKQSNACHETLLRRDEFPLLLDSSVSALRSVARQSWVLRPCSPGCRHRCGFY